MENENRIEKIEISVAKIEKQIIDIKENQESRNSD
jgi:hypothetical protein